MASHIREQIDLLCSLRLPDRYEPLHSVVGANLATILIHPPSSLDSGMQSLLDHIQASAQGCFVPLSGPSGAGKTTFARSATQWFARTVAPTIDYDGAITFDGLKAALEKASSSYALNDNRIVPINIDHRESDPPSPTEMANIKRFLRTSPGGRRNVIFWPETDPQLAQNIGKNYGKIAGSQPRDILEITGPDRSLWRDVAIATLRLSNNVSSLEKIGVDPRNYNPNSYPSLGEFLRQIQLDFNSRLAGLREEITKAIVLIVVFVSESTDPGVLNFINSAGRHGLLDSQGLLSSTPDSAIGRWWTGRQGLLVRAIVQLNAHALFLSPPVAVSVLRNFGPAAQEVFDRLNVARPGPAKAVADLGRTDVAKLLLGEPLRRYEG